MKNEKAALLLTFIIIMTLLSSGCIFNISPVIEAIPDQIGKVGQEFIYQVIAYDPDNGELTYSLTEKSEGMQIGSSAGLITWTPGENQIGTFTVEVKVSNGNNFSIKQFKITIEIIYLTSIEASPAAINVYVGNLNNITLVTAHYDYGDTADLALADCDYSSSNTGIATVSGNGVITGVSAGSAVITVTYIEEGISKTDTVSVTVEDISLTSIEVSPDNMSVYMGNSNTITSVTAHYDNGDSADLALADCEYTSGNTNIAMVDNSGVITGISAGSTIITVSYTEDGIVKTDTVSVTIEDISLTSIEVSPDNMSVYIGNSNTINSITAFYNDGSSASIGLYSADYSSNNPDITSVNTTGGITGVSTGTATITVSYTEGGITKSDTVSVTIEGIFLDYITVFPSTMSMYSGSLKNITSITAHYNNGSSASVELSSADYSSDNPGIASVNTTGGITGVSTGAAIITVTYTEDGIVKTDIVNVIIISPDGGGGGGG